ncbi:hypothetical protein ABZ464_03065 [Streptomyces sp. NPDC005820]|uniref:hypothetical protein n=1 Tax=Streptomyces sp. NPDC005820 TaxID=3157069 RepID=UPI0033EC8F9F
MLPRFTVPLTGDHRLQVAYRAVEDEAWVDFLVDHPAWARVERIARDDGHFMGPGLSWPELVAVADAPSADAAGADSHARLLLLLPAFGDDAIPAEAVERPARALGLRVGVADPWELATALLESQGPAGAVRWTTSDTGVRINDGRCSIRNPAQPFALAEGGLRRVSAALAP